MIKSWKKQHRLYKNIMTDRCDGDFTALDMKPLLEDRKDYLASVCKDKPLVCGPMSLSLGGWMLSMIGRCVPFVSNIISRTNQWLTNGIFVSCLKWIGRSVLFRIFRFIFGCIGVNLEYVNIPIPIDSTSMEMGNLSVDRICYEKDQLDKELMDMREQVDYLTKEKDTLKKENDTMRQSLKTQEQRIKSATDQLDKQIKCNQKLSEEKENALTRLSEVAGSKLKYNNPGITDLSDDNRPNKLSEKFSELYDNEWTEAFEALEGDAMKEEDIIEHLLNILHFVYEECCTRTMEKRNQMVQLVYGVGISNTQDQRDTAAASKVNVHVQKKISDLQKETATSIIPEIIQDLRKSLDPKLHPVVSKCGSYFDMCVSLCWLMRVQEPPVILNFDCEKGKEVNTDLYRHYTKTGTKIDFMVWPAMLLYKDGPMLLKGVFQPQC